MKHIQYIFTTAILFLISFNLYAQIGKIEEINATMSQGTNRGLKVLIPETSQKETIKTWSKLMKDYESKNEKIRKETDYLSPDAQIPSLGEQPMGSSYINSDMHPKQIDAAKKLITSFATRVAKASIQTVLNEETKKLEKLEKELKVLKRDKEKFENEIQNANETIVQREKDIKENTKNQAEKQDTITKQKSEVDKINTKLKKF